MMYSMILLALSSLLLSVNMVLGKNPSFNEILADPKRSFSTLANAFTIANIDITNDVTIPVTLFAPNNAAFGKMDPALLDKLLSAGFDAHLLNFLAMHLLPRVLNFVNFTNGQVLTAVNDEFITVSLTTAPRTLKLSSPNTVGAVVSLPSNASSDGVLYELHDVLLPKFATVDILTVASAPEFSIFAELLVSSSVADLFAPGSVVATVFAPTNDAFTALGAGALAYYRSNRTATAFLLLGHVIPHQVVSTLSIESGPMEYTSGVGETLSFVGTFIGTDFTFTINEANLLSPNILAVDGIVHSIDRVLAVAGAAIPTLASPMTIPVSSPVSSPVVMAPKQVMRMKGKVGGTINGVMDVPKGKRGM
jgi:transforming growth factor-beta-induced protein